MFKRIVVLVLFLSAWTASATADGLPSVEAVSVVGLGRCLSDKTGADAAMPMTGFVAQRLAFPKFATFSLEVSAVVPSGFGGNVLVDLVHQPKFRWHILDPGIHLNVFEPVTARHIERDWDVTVGTGVAWNFRPHWWLTADYRMYMPEPPRVIRNYGNLIIDTINSMPKEGQLWLGLGYSFSS